jgi:hypothetical protein
LAISVKLSLFALAEIMNERLSWLDDRFSRFVGLCRVDRKRTFGLACICALLCMRVFRRHGSCDAPRVFEATIEMGWEWWWSKGKEAPKEGQFPRPS